MHVLGSVHALSFSVYCQLHALFLARRNEFLANQKVLSTEDREKQAETEQTPCSARPSLGDAWLAWLVCRPDPNLNPLLEGGVRKVAPEVDSNAKYRHE